MLIEIHMLQNHAPSNLNRDDTGSPKDCIFGGVRRARISSQALKRAIRRSPLFAAGLKGADVAYRTRRLPEQVKELLLARGLAPDLAEAAAKKASGFGNKSGTEQEALETAQIMFLSPADIQAVADVLYKAAVEAGSVKAIEKLKADDLQKSAQLGGWRPITVDIALFGRMITSDAFRDVEASVQVAHAIGTHKMAHEFDYYTAVDDLPHAVSEDEKGAGMIGDVEFTSACFYKYFSLDVDDLLQNLTGRQSDWKDAEAWADHVAKAKELVALAVPAFLKAAVFSSPSGKQNAFAAHQLPDAILVEVRPDPIPVSYANAFVEPISPKAGESIVELSTQALAEHATLLTTKFALPSSERLWFTTQAATLQGATTCATLDELIAKLENAIAGVGGHG
jgi:CRISPR system Cascade subunit CasC